MRRSINPANKRTSSAKSQQGILLDELNRRLAFRFQDVATLAGISVPMVRKLVRDGRLSVVRIGRCVRVPRAAVMKLCGRE